MTEPDNAPRSSASKRLLLENRWGGQSLISLYISIVSGIIVALQYDPSDPFYSVATIELVLPYGSFWRALHYYSSQAFFLLLLAHLAIILWKNSSSYSRSAWVRLCCSVPLAVLLLFSGYVLRGDATGEAAGVIAENICLSIPLIGNWINDVFFDITDSGLKKVYAHHVIGFMALGTVSIWPHLKRYTAPWKNHLLLVFCLLCLSILLTTPTEPDRIGLIHIAGPWFFLGLQEVLRYLPTFLAGVAIPLFPIIALFLLQPEPRSRKGLLLCIIGWLCFYAIVTCLSYVRI